MANSRHRQRAGLSTRFRLRAPWLAATGTAHPLVQSALLAMLALAIASGMMTTPVAAQDPPPQPLLRGSIAGTVLDVDGIPVTGAQIQVIGLVVRGSTGSDGTFVLAGVPTGTRTLRVRRMGFQPESVSVEVPPGGEAHVELRLTPVPQRLEPVVVEASEQRVYTGRMARFWERRDRGGGGRFFTAEDIDRRNPTHVSDLLRMVPGVQVVQDGFGARIYFRGQRCLPLVWLDGMPATAGYLSPDNFSPGSLAGIEVYSGPATVPAELMWMRGKGACGVIALWTRLDDPPGREEGPKVTAAELASLVQSLRLYTADQVDEPAMPDTAAPVVPIYPDSLLREGVSGKVLVEFVVDSTGVADMATFGEVLSSGPRFTAAVRRAVAEARFTPAVVAGRPVRQLMQLPFRFVASSPAGGAR